MAKQGAKPAVEVPAHFFEQELEGEAPPTLKVMDILYRQAVQIWNLRAWDLLSESELVLVRENAGLRYCSVMGRLGEVFAVQGYIGEQGYRVFRRLSSGQLTDSGEYLGTVHAVTLDFVQAREVTAADRRLLTAFKHSARSMGVSPIFRCVRPGHRPWFITDEEAWTLARCLSAVIGMCTLVSGKKSVHYWDVEDVYPLLSLVDAEDGTTKVHVEQVLAPLPAEPPLPVARLGVEQIERLLKWARATAGVIELDYFVSDVVIGKKTERPTCMCIAMAADAKTGVILNWNLLKPSDPIQEALASTLMNAMAARQSVPEQVLVRSKRFHECLKLIGEAALFPIRVARSLPGIDGAKEFLLRQMKR